MSFQYLFAEKPGHKTLCIKYNARWRESMTDYLMDLGYRLRPAEEWYWNKRTDEWKRPASCYLLDDKVDLFLLPEEKP